MKAAVKNKPQSWQPNQPVPFFEKARKTKVKESKGDLGKSQAFLKCVTQNID
jgi:hypothetical protein